MSFTALREKQIGYLLCKFQFEVTPGATDMPPEKQEKQILACAEVNKKKNNSKILYAVITVPKGVSEIYKALVLQASLYDTQIKRNTHCSFPLLPLFLLSFNLTHDSACHESAHLVSVCECVRGYAPVSLSDSRTMSSWLPAPGLVFPDTSEPRPWDTVTLANLIWLQIIH